MRYKHKFKETISTYHRVLLDYATNYRSRSSRKATREVVILRFNPDEITMVKAFKKLKRATRKVLKEVISYEYLEIPRSFNRY